MNLTLAYIPYLNMKPFHQGFGPGMTTNGLDIQWKTLSPRALGIETKAGRIDAGAMSLVDSFELENEFEPLAYFGIGVREKANTVLLFSKKPIAELNGLIAVTDETSTSVCLLEVLLRERYGKQIDRPSPGLWPSSPMGRGVLFARIASAALFDGDSDALLLIGDEALQAKKEGIKGFPRIYDLGQEWFEWQKMPFAFARWMVRKTIPNTVKAQLRIALEKSLAQEMPTTATNEEQQYWQSFDYRLTPAHLQSIVCFKSLLTTQQELCSAL